MTTRPELEELLAVGSESRSFEVKGPASLGDKPFVARVARAAMALGNLQDGGVLCLGINDSTIAAMQPGLDPVQFAAWSDNDDVSDALARYSDPPVAFTLRPIELSNGARVVVLDIREFDVSPHICARDYPEVLQQGRVYVRPRGKPESVPVPSALAMRELLDLATTKAVRRFVAQAAAAGMLPSMAHTQPPGGDADEAAFVAEAQHTWSGQNTRVDQITAGTYFEADICPGPYRANRISASRLEAFAIDNTVRLRGWPVPYVSPREPVRHFEEWIGQEVEPDRVPHHEAWRLTTSGQFLQRRVPSNDLRSTMAEGAPTLPEATGAVMVWDVLLWAVEVAVLASRISASLQTATATIKISLHNIAGRQLVSGDLNRELHHSFLFSGDSMQATATLPTAELLANPRSVGVQLAQQLFGQFGADFPDQVLDDWQQNILQDRYSS